MALSSKQSKAVKKLAKSGNKAAQNYLKTGKAGGRNEQVTDNKGRSLSLTRDASGKATGVQRDVNTITAESLKPAPKINLPPPPAVDGLFGTTDAINAGLASLSGGTYDASTKQIVPAPAQTPAESPDKYTQLFQSYLGAQADNKMPSMVDSVKEQQKMLKPYESRVNSLQNQLNTITTARDAQMLGLEGQGRGQTQSFIGGEQARISREAAITALPIQAQLAAAQDDLESARTYAGQYFQAKMQDAQNLYNYKKELNASIFSFLTASEQRKQAANEKQLDRDYAERQAATQNAQKIALQAIEYGQSSLAGRIMGLDPKSPTYAQDVSRAMAELRKPVTATKRDTAFDKDGNLVDMQTGEIVRAATPGDTPNAGLDGKPLTQAQQKVQGFADRLVEAEKVLVDSNKFASFFAVGADLPNYLKTADRQKYEQAKRNFVNAVLRTESGAVIADSEFANAELQYFPQRGDSAGVVAQKAANRNTVINNFYREANVPRPVNAGDIIESDGKRYKVADDGVTLIEL